MSSLTKSTKNSMEEMNLNENLLSVELFLNERFTFRNNVLNGKVEFAKKLEDGNETDYRVLLSGADATGVEQHLDSGQA